MSAEPLADVDSQRGEVTFDAHPTSGPAIAEPEQGEGQVDEQGEVDAGEEQHPQGVDPLQLASDALRRREQLPRAAGQAAGREADCVGAGDRDCRARAGDPGAVPAEPGNWRRWP